MSAQERLDYLLEVVETPTNQLVTVAAIVSAVGLDAGRLVVGTIQAGAAQDPILAASLQALSTVGMSLSSADRQMLIDELAAAGQWPDSVRDAVKALGVVRQPRWQIEGYLSEPTLEQVALELAKQLYRSQFDAILNKIGTAEQAEAVTQLRAIADELEAS